MHLGVRRVLLNTSANFRIGTPVLTWESSPDVNPPLLVLGLPVNAEAGDLIVIQKSTDAGATWSSYFSATVDDANASSQDETATELTNGDYVLRCRLERGGRVSEWSTSVNITIEVDAGYSTTSARFDGTNDFMSRGGALTSVSDHAYAIISFWVDFKGGDASYQVLFEPNAQSSPSIQRDNSNKLHIYTTTPGTSGLTSLASTSDFSSTSGRKHVLAALNATTGQSLLYVNDVLEHNQTHSGATTHDFTDTTDFFFGCRVGGNLKLNAEVSDFYFNIGEFLDLSVEANRRKFIDASGNPVDLGTTGQLPTGNTPDIFLKGGASSFSTNLGTGGSFTVTGALTDGAVVP